MQIAKTNRTELAEWIKATHGITVTFVKRTACDGSKRMRRVIRVNGKPLREASGEAKKAVRRLVRL